jgi:hypothetical protein
MIAHVNASFDRKDSIPNFTKFLPTSILSRLSGGTEQHHHMAYLKKGRPFGNATIKRLRIMKIADILTSYSDLWWRIVELRWKGRFHDG